MSGVIITLDDCEDTYATMDSRDQETFDLYEAIFSKYAGVMKPALARIYDPDGDGEDAMFQEPILVVERIEIMVKHRGRGVGLLAMKALLDHFRGQVRLVFCNPNPTHHLPDPEHPRDATAREYFDAIRAALPRTQQQRALQKYWSRAGFRKLGRGPYYVVNLHNRR
jgi:hypothetical protein